MPRPDPVSDPRLGGATRGHPAHPSAGPHPVAVRAAGADEGDHLAAEEGEGQRQEEAQEAGGGHGRDDRQDPGSIRNDSRHVLRDLVYTIFLYIYILAYVYVHVIWRLQKGPVKPKDLEKMYDSLVKETDKAMDELRKLLQKQKNEEEQVRVTSFTTFCRFF